MRNETRSQNTFPPPLPYSQALLHSHCSPSSPLSGTVGQGMGVMVSSSHVVSATSSSSGGGLLTLFLYSSLRSLSHGTVLHKLLQHDSFPWGAALHKLPQCASLPRVTVLQEQAAPAWVPHGVWSPASKPALVWCPLSMGPQVLAGACSGAGSPWGHSLLQAYTCSAVGSLPRARGGDLLHRGPPWTAGGQPASPWLSSRAAKEKNLCSDILNNSHPPSSLTLVSAELFLSQSLTPLSRLPFHCRFFPFLNMISQRHHQPLLIGLALASSWSILELAGIGSVRHEGSYLQLLTQPPLQPPRY